MSRVLGWLRVLRLWFTARRLLHERCRLLERRAVEARRERDAVQALHEAGAAEMRAKVFDLRREAQSLDGLLQANNRDLCRERRYGNNLAQRLRRADLIADDLPAEFAARLRRETRPQLVEEPSNA